MAFSSQHYVFKVIRLLLTVGHALLWLSSIPSCEYTSLFIHSPVEGHCRLIVFEVIIDKASLNFCIQVFCENRLLFLPW